MLVAANTKIITKENVMKNKINTGARFLLGFILTLFGSNKFFEFIPTPVLPKEAGEFMMALGKSGYILTIVGLVQIIVGILLLSGRFVPLALLLLAPISVNIITFHLFLDLAGIGGAAMVTILNIYLLWQNKEKYQSVLQAK